MGGNLTSASQMGVMVKNANQIFSKLRAGGSFSTVVDFLNEGCLI